MQQQCISKESEMLIIIKVIKSNKCSIGICTVHCNSLVLYANMQFYFLNEVWINISDYLKNKTLKLGWLSNCKEELKQVQISSQENYLCMYNILIMSLMKLKLKSTCTQT